ncbi:MAG: mechanosensitive ion channel [Saprospiraceae bacterium]|nr:mechanosensitive ion channel [Saprospiraceae bacterium]MBK6566720.1 mechanosensitive ion channel [Saprospiraceae bacterium]MBK7522945.1 mechanosensitive ion channel [Saprospiraceae bacterium]MBK8081793.1 mechanosensitive ion channel [Saprospiraceae bacterium]MBK8370678.1 mechanosensitive ion channel [Saprospiraceae bacterium]
MKQVLIKYLMRFVVLFILLYTKQELGEYENFLGKAYPILKSTLNFIILLVSINIFTALLIMVYRIRKKLAYKFTDNVIVGVNNVYYLIVTIGVIIMLFGFWGIDMGKLLTSLSIFAAALAIISKEFVASIISGIIISFSNDINIDDYVKIGNNKGKILDINLAKISLLNEDDDIIFIPNDKVYMSDIINYTRRDIKKVSIDFELDLLHLTSITSLEDALKNNIKEFLHLIEPNTVALKIVDIHKDYILFKFQFKLKEVNRELEKIIRKKTVRIIVDIINQHKTIPVLSGKEEKK